MLKDNREIGSTHLTPLVIEKIGIAALISIATLTILTIMLGFAAVLMKMNGV